MSGDKIPVVIRHSVVTKMWHIAHAASYQNAFRSEYNRFGTRQEAVDFSLNNGCRVEFHDIDPSQTTFAPKEEASK